MTISMAALLLHACLLGGLDWAWPARAAVRAHAPAMQVRSVAANLAPTEAVLDEAPIEPAPAEAALQTAPSKPVRPALHRVARAVRAMGPRPEAAPRVSDIQARVALIDPEPQTETMAIPVLASTVAAVAEASIDAGGDELVPVYRTRLPPAMTLRYQMSRGILHGTGELQWRPAADHYELRLEGRVAGLAILTQTSAGGFDAAGLAPLRFTDQRMRRAAVAANFQRDADKITFSGPSAELPLLPGEQDRLSWMVQLAAIAAAEPGLLVPGGKIVMHVVGARADPGVWAFRYLGREAVATRAGAVAAIKLMREPPGLHDTQAEVWLDPRQHHLPVRAILRNGSDGDELELMLQEAIEAP